MTTNPDTLSRFILEQCGVRGEHVHLDTTWQTLHGLGKYAGILQDLLGETVAAVAMLAATIKFDGSLILQARGDGALRLLVVEASGGRTLRGLARRRADWPDPADVAALLGKGQLALTIDPGEGKDRYQGIVDFDGGSMATALERYFERSEQIPTRIWLACDATRAAGLMLQHLPDRGAVAQVRPGRVASFEDNDDGWRRCVTLADTVRSHELLELEAPALLRRLYHQEQVRLFEPERWGFRCRCSRDRVRTMLKGLGKAEVDDILEEQGSVNVTCEFCNADYSFDSVDAEQVFAGDGSAAPGWEM